MRPIKLTMTAFGAYAKNAVIDFDKLGTRGLYLITGDTGAGKTTIFDAVSFALFGEPSGEFRSSEMFRSRYADPNTRTEVELIFNYLGENYKITRSLSYERAKQRGEGTIKVDGVNRLEFTNGNKPLEKKSEVDKKIEDLLGITKDQFKQIVMLAQGDFRRMLFSNTDDRRKIFQRIFNTEVYARFEEKIKEKARNSKTDFLNSKREILLRISDVKCSGESGELAELQQSISENELPNLSTLEEFRELLKAQNDSDKARYNSMIEEKNSVFEEWKKLSDEIVKLKENYKDHNDLKKLREKIPALEKLAAESKKFSEQTELENSPKIDELKKQAALIENTLGDYKKTAESEKALNALKQRLEEEISEHEKLIKEKNKVSEKLDNFKKEFQELKNSETNIANLNSEKINFERRKNDISALSSALCELEKKELILTDCRKKYQSAREKSEKLSEKAKNLRRSFNDEQAGIIAQTLEDGKECPVCGSIHHPKKAVKSENAPSQSEVEKAEELAKKAADAENSASVESGKAQGSFSEAQNAAAGQIEKLALDCKLENARETASEELEKLENSLAEITKAINTELANNKRREELEKIIPGHENKISELNSKINELEKQAAADKTAIGEKSSQIAEQRSKLKFESESAAVTEIKKLGSDAEILAQNIKSAQEKSALAVKELDGAKTEINTLSKRIPENYSPADLDEKNAELAVLDDRKNALDNSAKDIEKELENNSEILKKISESIPKLKKQEEELTLIEGLSNAANGKSKFETFVQTEYFRDILNNANVHFMRMSNDQYELIRKEIPDDKKSDHTLDLNVRDHYNGTVRDVRSLSGGESFIASLSLALGLSETVQQNAGGIKLETMFVDEGFGSLDDETLDQAMKALNSLTESDRLIGIISHVEAVKRDISKKIIVKKDGANGSTAEVVV